jgi:predicted RNA-binding protein YlxR (DUF448 family)
LRQVAAEREQDRETADTVRRCVVTRALRPKDELIRFVLSPDGEVAPDLKEKLPGRGVWLTAAHDTVAEALKRNAFARTLKQEARAPQGLDAQIDKLLSEAAISALSLANKTGEVVFGYAKVEEAIAKGRVVGLIHARETAEDGRRKLGAKLRGKKGGTSLPAVRVFTVDELGLASGRTNVIHAALIQGGAALKVLAAASRLERYRKGSAAFRNPSELDTNNE